MLLGFKERFAEPILKGTKTFTMRGKRKIQPKIGERLYMYSGLRTSNCKKISDKEKLISKQKARIIIKSSPKELVVLIYIDGKLLEKETMNEFVVRDGFKTVLDFAVYWTKAEGKKRGKNDVFVDAKQTIYHWTDLRY